MSAKQANPTRDIAILVSVPLVFAVILAAIVYVPQWLARPAYDFIYAICDSYKCDDDVSMYGGHVLPMDIKDKDRIDSTLDIRRAPQLRYFNVSKQSHRTLTTDEAKAYKLDTSSRSPDGYVLSRESSSPGFLFWGSGGNRWILKKGLYKKPVELVESPDYYNNITLVGWVK